MSNSSKSSDRDLSKRVYVYKLGADGRWSYGRNPMTDTELARQFFADIERDESGKYFIICEGERCEARVADAPSFVEDVGIEQGPQGITAVQLTLTSGVKELLDPSTLSTGRGGALYCVDSRGFPTRFHREPHLKLARHIAQDPRTGDYFLEVGGTRYRVRVDS